MCLAGEASRPTLYIKSNVIDLYFVTKNDFLTLELINVDDDLLVYLIGVNEGEETPLYLYSSIECLSEKHAIRLIEDGSQLDVILFNDFAIEVARTIGSCEALANRNDCLADFCPPGPDYCGEHHDRVLRAVSDYTDGKRNSNTRRIILSKFESKSISHVISGEGNSMEIIGFKKATEVHEMLPQIVEDHTLLTFFHSPSVEVSDGNVRELSDAIILGSGSLISLQAKCFDFEGETPPTNRSNAEKRMRKNVRKAIAQTRGSARMIRERKTIFSKDGPIDVPEQVGVNFAIFIPSLDLISEELESELAELGKHLNAFGEGLVVLDPMQFLRTVQAAEGVFSMLGCTADEAFFDLIQKSSQRALTNGSYRTPTLYRW